MPDPDDLNGIRGDPVDNHIEPNRRDLTRAGRQTKPAPLGQMFEAVARGHKLNRAP